MGAILRPRDSRYGDFPPFLIAAGHPAPPRCRKLVFRDDAVIVLVEPREQSLLRRGEFGQVELAVAVPVEPLEDPRRDRPRLGGEQLIILLAVEASALGEGIELLLRELVEFGTGDLPVPVRIIGVTKARTSARSEAAAAGSAAATAAAAPAGRRRISVLPVAPRRTAGNFACPIAVHLLEAVALGRHIFVGRDLAVSVPVDAMKILAGLIAQILEMNGGILIEGHHRRAFGCRRELARKRLVELVMRDLAVLVCVELGNEFFGEPAAPGIPGKCGCLDAALIIAFLWLCRGCDVHSGNDHGGARRQRRPQYESVPNRLFHGSHLLLALPMPQTDIGRPVAELCPQAYQLVAIFRAVPDFRDSL